MLRGVFGAHYILLLDTVRSYTDIHIKLLITLLDNLLRISLGLEDM